MLKKSVFFFICFLMLPITGFTLGLGNITAFSKLNEPLKVRIELLNSKSTRLDEIIVKNASSETYRRANLPSPDTFNKVHFITKKESNGSVIVELTTKYPVRDILITFIADLKWRTGHTNREYTLLLDPPEFIQKQIHPGFLFKKELKPLNKASAKQATVLPTPSKVNHRKIDYSTVIANHIDGDIYTTKRADTLWEIAGKVKPDKNVTTYQTMQALFALNPDAFINNNINLLKQGQTLKIPTQNEIRQINGKSVLTTSSAHVDKSTPDKTISKKGILESKTQLKIIPPTETLLNTPVTSKKDLILINKALQNSIITIKSLKNDNEELNKQINALTEKLDSLDSHNLNLNDKISKINRQLNNQQNSPASSTLQQTSHINAQRSGDSNTPVVDNISPTQQSEDTTLEIDSELTQAGKSKSLIRESLTNSAITIVLVIFTLIILVATLFTIRRQKQKEQDTYIPYPNDVIVKSPRSYPSESTQNNNTKADIPTLSSLQETGINDEENKDEEGMDFFEYFEKKINAPETAPTASRSSNQSLTPAIAPETKVDAEVKVCEEGIAKPKSINTTLSEIDTNLAYGNYNEAEKLILSELQQAPSDKSLHLKVFECYAHLNKRYEFIQHAENNINLLNIDMVLRHRIENLFQQTWDEPLDINKFN